ncbi:hypothetical protein ABRY23_04605 [Melioribacteraceae bacterium 4301-Me]|uniref:hypothetical protein n=1 Tax=Pyranulibacter aquaticus TaxID=3163344 RepID=UPI003598CF0E
MKTLTGNKMALLYGGTESATCGYLAGIAVGGWLIGAGMVSIVAGISFMALCLSGDS